MANAIHVCRTVLLRRPLARSAAQASRAACLASPAAAPARPVASSAFFSTSSPARKAAAAAAKAPTPDATAADAAEAGAAVDGASPAPLSSCPEGTVLLGLNYTKGRTDPVALRDEAYPAWLWNCLDVMKKAATEEDADMGDEFCTCPAG